MPAQVIDWGFETLRVRGRLIAADDRALYRALYTDPSVMDKIGAVMTETDVDVLLEKVCRCNAQPSMIALYWRLSDRASDAPIGQLSAIRAVETPSRIELGLMLLPDRQGQRFGSEVLAHIVDCLMDHRWGLGIDTVMACSSPANAGVNRLGALLGFRHAGQNAEALNRWILARTDWLARREASSRPASGGYPCSGGLPA